MNDCTTEIKLCGLKKDSSIPKHDTALSVSGSAKADLNVVAGCRKGLV